MTTQSVWESLANMTEPDREKYLPRRKRAHMPRDLYQADLSPEDDKQLRADFEAMIRRWRAGDPITDTKGVGRGNH